MKRVLLIALSLFCILSARAQTSGLYSVPIPNWIQSQTIGASMASANNGHVFILGKTGFPYQFNGIGILPFDSTNFSTGINYGIDEVNGKLWVANANGLYTYTGTTWFGYNPQNCAMPIAKVNCVKAVDDVTIYAGTDLGLVRKSTNGFQTFNTSNSDIINDTIKSIDVLGNGEVIVGTAGGVSIFDGTNWTNFNIANSALKSNKTAYIKACQNNTFWAVTAAAQDSTEIYPGYFLFKNGQFIAVADMEESCIHRSILTSNSSIYSVDGNGNLIVRLVSGHFKKYIHPDNAGIKSVMLKTSIGGVVCNTGVYSNFGFDCYISGSNLMVFFDTCFTSAYVIDSVQSEDLRAVIDINNIKSTIRSIGDLHTGYDKISENQVPKNACTNTALVGALWLGGVDGGGNLHGAAMTYRQTGVDYWPGPLDTVTLACPDVPAYNKMWKINKSMILDFQQNYQNGIAYIHPDILTWPGNGTGNMAKRLAPFIDLNSNGIYEPVLGDYPELSGDEMVYWIFNDMCNVHSETGCSPLGVEIHGTAYAFVCDDIDPNSIDYALNNTVFYKYKIYNRSVNSYHDFYTSWWYDVDLGYYMDDYIGCDVNRNAAFVYNGDNYDEGMYGYGLNPPMQSYVQLAGPLAPANDGVDNNHDGQTDENYEQLLFTNFMSYNNDFTISGNPENCTHIYNYMQNKWKDGSHTVYNGANGYGSGTPTNYVFPTAPYTNGNPGDSLPPWNEVTSGNGPGDRRFIMSCGPTDLGAGGVVVIEYATVFSHYTIGPNGANTSFALNNAYVDKVTDWYNAQSFPSCYDPTPVAEIQADNSKLIVYPNPATNVVNIKLAGQTGVLDFYMTDMAGKVVLRGKGNSINIDGLANGMYLLYVAGEKGTFYSKLIKQ